MSRKPKPGWLVLRYTSGRWRPDRVENWQLVNQLRKEAGLAGAKWPDGPEAYDRILAAASAHDMGLEATDDCFEKCASLHAIMSKDKRAKTR